MATGGLLLHHHHHHHLLHSHPRPSLHLTELHYPLNRRSAYRQPFPAKRFAASPCNRGHLQPTLRSIQCLKQEEQAGSDGEAVEWVNKAAHDPMVEFDPVTVFRRIVAERHASASLAMARAKEEAAKRALHTTSSPPFIPGHKWFGKSGIAIITALLLLAVAAALYFLRSRKDGEDATELTSADAKDTLETSVDHSRRKLVEDTVQAPQSVLTAMALGAASVSRPKAHIGSTHDTVHASSGTVLESQRPEGTTEFHPVASTVAVEDMESDLLGKSMFGQMPMPYSSSIVEGFTPLGVENVGVDVTEGPWFGQGVNDAEMVALATVQEHESEIAPLIGAQKLESNKPEQLRVEDGLVESQALAISNETTALPAAELFTNETSVGEAGFEALVLTENVVNGEFHGEVVAVSGQLNHSNIKGFEFKFEKSQIDSILVESSVMAEKLKQIVEDDSIPPLEGNSVADDDICPEPSILIGSSAPDHSNGQFVETDSESDDNDNDNITPYGVEQSFTLNQDDGIMSSAASDGINGFEDVQVAEGYLSSPNLDFVSTEEEETITDLLSHVDNTLEEIEMEADDVLDGLSSSTNTFQIGQVEEDKGVICDPRKELSIDYGAMASREDSEKALEAAVPAIAIGVGTVGALFGVAGGLQVVGFAALASILSHDFLWAQSRESLWQELNGITDRQKLLDFLAKRNIMKREAGKSNL